MKFKFKWDRIISLATLATSVVALILVLKKPQPVAAPQTAKAVSTAPRLTEAQTATA